MNLEWTAEFDSTKKDAIAGIAVNENEDVFAVGYSDDLGSENIFTQMYDSNGNFKNEMGYRGSVTSDNKGLDIVVDSDGNPIVVGKIRNTGTNLDAVILKYCIGCLINDECIPDQAEHPTEGCKICDVATSQTAWTDNDGAACDDGLYCNGDDTCGGGTCSVHAGDPCQDNLWCTGTDTCNETDDSCTHEYDDASNPRRPDDGQFCTGDESCDETNDQCASSGDPCGSNETCDESADSCTPNSDDDDDDGDDDDDDSTGDDDDDAGSSGGSDSSDSGGAMCG